MSRIALTVLVKETYLSQFALVVEGCREQGMTVDREMISLGAFSGNIDAGRLSDLKSVDGIDKIESDRPMRAC